MFLRRKREKEERDATRGIGPTQEGGWRGQGLGRATWPSGLVVAPLVSHRCPLVAFYLKTLDIIFL